MTNIIRRDANLAPVLGLLNQTTGKVEEAMAEDGPVKPQLVVANYAFDTTSMSFIRMTQPLSDVDDLESLMVGNYFKDVRFAYSPTGDCEYKGSHLTMNVSEDDVNWVIIKFEYMDGNCTRKRCRVSSWAGRENSWS